MVLTDLTIIIPNFNHSKYIDKCFSNLKKLKLMPREFVVIDDCSTDHSIDLINKNISKFSHSFPEVKILFIKNKKNRGVIYCDNLGAKKASSRYIYFASVDDTINPDFIKKSMESLEKYTQAVFCSCIVNVKSPNGQSVNFPLKNPLNKIGFISPLKSREILNIRDFWTGGNSSIYKREIYLELGGLREKFHSCSDIFLSMVVVAKYGGVFIPEQLTTFYLSENSYSAKLYAYENITSLEKIYEEMANTFLKEYPDIFTKSFVNSWKERHKLRLKLISYKKFLEKQKEIFTDTKHNILYLTFNFFTTTLNYALFIMFLLGLFVTKSKIIKNMILSLFIIKIKQKRSLLKMNF